MDEMTVQTPETQTQPAPEQISSEKKSLLKKPLDPRLAYYLRIIGTLFAITAIVAVLLALANLLTKPSIDRRAEEKRLAALAEVIPDAEYEAISALPPDISGLVFMARATQDGAARGYCVQVVSNGFGGPMELMVGLDTHGAITGVSLLSMSETPGVGTRVKTEPWFTQQFLGRSGESVSNIQPISGATTTSTAVTNAVNTALRAVSAYTKGGFS